MLKKVTIVLGTLLAVGVLGLFAAGSVFAQGPAPANGGRAQAPLNSGLGWAQGDPGLVCDAVADLLGMTRQEIYDARSSGKTLSQIANEKGVTDQQLIDAIVAAKEEAVTQALEAGQITQAQADQMLETITARAELIIDKPLGPSGFGMGRMRGGFGLRANGTTPCGAAAPIAQ